MPQIQFKKRTSFIYIAALLVVFLAIYYYVVHYKLDSKDEPPLSLRNQLWRPLNPNSQPVKAKGCNNCVVWIHDVKECMYISGSILKSGYWHNDLTEKLVGLLNSVSLNSVPTRPPVFLDVGANLGWFSLVALSHGAKVIAVEPLQYNTELLRSSIQENRYNDRSKLFQFALTDQVSNSSEPATVCIKPAYGSDSISGNKFNGQINSKKSSNSDCLERVKLSTLSFLLENTDDHSKGWSHNIDVMKMDCEGYEVRVLEGAMAFFKKHPPCVIQTEFIPEYVMFSDRSPSRLFEILFELGYDYVEGPLAGKPQKQVLEWASKVKGKDSFELLFKLSNHGAQHLHCLWSKLNRNSSDHFNTLRFPEDRVIEKSLSAPKYQIPKIIHQVWIGDQSKAYCRWMNTFKNDFIHKHPGWTYKLWNLETFENTYGRLRNRAIYDIEFNIASKADILRYEIIYQEGGFYMDADSIWLGKSLDEVINSAQETGLMTVVHANDVHRQVQVYDLKHTKTLYANGVFAAAPKHPAINQVIDTVRNEYENLKIFQKQPFFVVTGPFLFSSVVHQYPHVAIEANVFFPTGWFAKWHEHSKKYKDFDAFLQTIIASFPNSITYQVGMSTASYDKNANSLSFIVDNYKC